MRDIGFIPDFTENPLASVLISMGKTKVLTTISMSDKTPPFVEDGFGWLTSEYSLLPGSTNVRVKRERNHIGGRTSEIQRLIGRSIRMAVDRSLMPNITLTIDADVIQADGGTRTASINGAMLALFVAGERLVKKGILEKNPVVRWVGAISAGVVDGKEVVDLDYKADFAAETDCNFVFDETGNIIEIQGTAEEKPVNQEVFLSLLSQSKMEIIKIIETMKKEVKNFLI